jgi:hypothetical protein
VTARVDNERRDDVARTRMSVALWFAVLGGPAAGLANVVVSYSAVDRACVNDSVVILHVLTVFFLLVALAAGATAWRLRERIGDWPLTAAGMLGRSRFMATLGILTATVSIFGIILQWIPIFFIGACHGT